MRFPFEGDNLINNLVSGKISVWVREIYFYFKKFPRKVPYAEGVTNTNGKLRRGCDKLQWQTQRCRGCDKLLESKTGKFVTYWPEDPS